MIENFLINVKLGADFDVPDYAYTNDVIETENHEIWDISVQRDDCDIFINFLLHNDNVTGYTFY